MQRILFSAIISALGLVAAGTVTASDLGLIHGTITLDDDSELTGVMRWGEQEVLWIHHFNGDKAEPFDLSALPDKDREHIEDNLPGPRFEFNGHTIELARWLGSSELRPQPFAIEFGHIDQLVPDGGEHVIVTLRDGSVVHLDGGSDDIDTELEILTAGGSRHEVDWDEIEKVRFHAPDQTTASFPAHLHGVVSTRDGDFTGYVEWDHDERFPEEELDGDDETGQERSIDFGSILSITSRGASSLVVLTDGTQTVLSGTNDVDADNRGIVVTVPGLGRLDVPWTAFEKVTFSPPAVPPPAYADFAGGGA